MGRERIHDKLQTKEPQALPPTALISFTWRARSAI